MQFKVSLFNKETREEGEVIVSQVTYKSFYGGYWVKLEGTDPECYPDMARNTERVGDTRIWASSNLTFMLKPDDPLDVVAVATTDEPIPDPEPVF